jgi:3-isopropylmalate/(R)-2-methylmalate dehydratase large subunit
MGKTMSEKILARAAGVAETSAGEILWVNVDKAMMDDLLGPRVEIADQMKAIRD